MGFAKVDRRDRRCRLHISRRDGIVKWIMRGDRSRFDGDFSFDGDCAASPSRTAVEETGTGIDVSVGGGRKGFADTTTWSRAVRSRISAGRKVSELKAKFSSFKSINRPIPAGRKVSLFDRSDRTL